MRDAAQTEYRRLLARLRRHGPAKATNYVCDLVRTGGYPLWYPYKFTSHLMKRRELMLAGTLLKTVNRYGGKDPLIDKVYSKWLWATGDRKLAIRFLEKKAKFWSKSYLFNLLSAMYALIGKNKQSQHHLQVALSLADEELTDGAMMRRARKREMEQK